MNNNLLPRDGEVYLYEDLFDGAESDRLFAALANEVPWKHEPIKMFGRELMQPRLTAWYGDEGTAYTYSGITMQPLPWSEPLADIKRRIEAATGHGYNSALLNYYRDGNDSMGWHQDNERSLGRNPVIASVSFGAMRTFQLKHLDGDLLVKVPLAHGSLLLMQGATQHYWRHALLKEKRMAQGRINITFRKIIKDI